jgi:hypothetical protein
VSSQGTTNAKSKEVSSAAVPQDTRGVQRKDPVEPPKGITVSKVGNSVHIPRKVPRRPSSFKELVNKARLNALPLPQSSLADLSEDDEFPDTPPDRLPRRFAQSSSISAIQAGSSIPGRGERVCAGTSNARDAADKRCNETLVFDPENRQTDAKDGEAGRVAGILRNPIRTRSSPDYEAEDRASDQNVVIHSSRPQQERSEDKNATDTEGKKPLLVHALDADDVSGTTTAPTIPRINSSLVAKSVATSSSQPPDRQEIIHESDSRAEKAKSLDPGMSKTKIPTSTSKTHSPHASDHGSRPRVHTPPPPEFLQLRRTQQRDNLHSDTQSPHGRSLPPRDSSSGRIPVPGNNEKVVARHERIREPTRAVTEGGFTQREPGNIGASAGSRHRERSAREYATDRQGHPHESRRDWSQLHQRRSFSDVDRSWNGTNRPRSSERDRWAESSTSRSSEAEFRRRSGDSAHARNVSRGMGFERGNEHRAPGRTSHR